MRRQNGQVIQSSCNTKYPITLVGIDTFNPIHKRNEEGDQGGPRTPIESPKFNFRIFPDYFVFRLNAETLFSQNQHFHLFKLLSCSNCHSCLFYGLVNLIF